MNDERTGSYYNSERHYEDKLQDLVNARTPVMESLAEIDDLVMSETGCIRSAGNTSEPVKDLMASLDMGVMPSMASLLAIKDCFDLYFDARGQVSLEDAFFCGRKDGFKNYSKKIENERQCRLVEFTQIAMSEPDKRAVSQSKAVDELLTHLKIDDRDGRVAENLLQKYKRWRRANKKQ